MARGDRSAKQRLLDAAIALVRARGYAATSVDALCARAGVTKGAFFHHFASKDELAVEAARRWAETTGAFFATAPYHEPDDPLERVRAYIDFRAAIIEGSVAEFTCFAGTLVQEIHETGPAIREACAAAIEGHASTLVADIEDAMARTSIDADWTAESLALHTQAVLQGAFVLAKATGRPEAAIESVRHLRRYIDLLFAKGQRQ